jgi:hypothetical protein
MAGGSTLVWASAPHKDAPLSKANSLSGGRYRPGRIVGGVILLMASSFSAGSTRV